MTQTAETAEIAEPNIVLGVRRALLEGCVNTKDIKDTKVRT